MDLVPTDAEVAEAERIYKIAYDADFGRGYGMRRALESFLQGRAKPAQEEITDAHRALIEAADAVLKNEEHAVSCGARSYQKGSPTWEVYKELDACIRASKGEKT